MLSCVYICCVFIPLHDVGFEIMYLIRNFKNHANIAMFYCGTFFFSLEFMLRT